MKKIETSTFLLLGIIFVSIFFRFYNFLNLQVWTGDDEIITATIRHIVWTHSPILLIPNSALGFGLGPYYYYILSIFYFLTSFNLTLVQAVASALGVATTFLIYLCGKEIYNQKLGLVASFLYASSFLLSLLDRRLWPLTPGPFLASLTIFALAKINKKDFRYLAVLAIPFGFAFHSDLYLLVLNLTIAACWLLFKYPFKNKYTIIFLVITFLFSATFILAEFKYHGAVSGPIIKSISRPLRGEGVSPAHFYESFSAIAYLNVLSRAIFTPSSSAIESQWCHGNCNYGNPVFSPLTQIVVIILLIYSFLLTFKARKRIDKNPLILWIMMVVFIIGVIIFNKLFKANFNQLYFLVIFPAFLLLVAYPLVEISKKSNLILIVSLAVYFLVNIYSLVNSSIKYPLYQKIRLVKESSSILGDKKFSLYASSAPEIQGGGWTELYNINKKSPVNSYWYTFAYWIYAAYSLFPAPLEENVPERIIVIQKANDKLEKEGLALAKLTYKDLDVYVLQNAKVQGN